MPEREIQYTVCSMSERYFNTRWPAVPWVSRLKLIKACGELLFSVTHEYYIVCFDIMFFY